MRQKLRIEGLYSDRLPIVVSIIGIFAIAISLSEILGYSWPVLIGSTLFLSRDSRPIESLVSGIFIGGACSFLVLSVFTRRTPLAAVLLERLRRLIAIVSIWSFGFISLSRAENVIYLNWIAGVALVFIVSLVAILPSGYRTSRRLVFIGLVLTILLTMSIAIPGFLSSQEMTVVSATINCNVRSCSFGIADETSPGPPWGHLLQGRTYDFYFDVVQGKIQAKLTSAPGTGDTTFWVTGQDNDPSQWTGTGVRELQWTSPLTNFYQLVLLNPDPTTAIVQTRVTIAN